MSKNAPRVQFNFMEDEVPESNITMEIDDDDDDTIDTLEVPEVIEREEVNEENIFDTGETKQKVEEPIVKKEVVKKEVKTTKTGKPRKPMSAEHKEKLAFARQKAIESRRQKQKERQEQREFEAQEKELLKKKKQKDFEKLKKEVNDEEPEPKPQPQPQIIQQTFTKRDLEEAQLDAIIKYEAIRKERKAKKKEQELIQKQRDEMKAKINNYGSRTNGILNNRYDICY